MSRNLRLALAIGFVVFLFGLLTFRVLMSGIPVDEISWSDVRGEVPLAILAFIWMILSLRVVRDLKIFTPLMVGFTIFFLGGYEDVLDEFYEFSATLGFTSIENIMWIGMIFVGIGLYRWTKALDQRDALKGANAELIATKENLEKKGAQLEKVNAEMEKTLDQFYTMRIGVMEDIKKGKYKEENEEIKKRLDNIRAMKESQ